MALPGSTHMLIGSYPYELDLKADDAYVRWTQSVAPNTADIQGNPGTNLSEHELRWDITNFAGEGQKVIDIDDPDSPSRFYTSEGLDFRTAGEFRLNRSTVLQRPAHTGGTAATTLQGNADMSDVTGTSTASGTDRRLNALNAEVGTGNRTPGLGTTQVDFYCYHEEAVLTTTEGSSLDLKMGWGRVSATDHTLESEGTVVGTAGISGLTAGSVYEVNFYAKLSAALGSRTPPSLRCQIVDVTQGVDPRNAVVVNGSVQVEITSTDSTLIKTNQFTAVSGKTYQFWFLYSGEGGGEIFVLADKVTYGPTLSTNNSVRLSIYNVSGTAEVVAQTYTITSTAAGALIGSLTFAPLAATNYSYRVRYASGGQRPWVDKVVETVQTSGANLRWDPELLDLGQGGNIWMAGYNANAAPVTWTYDFATEDWDQRNAFGSSGNKPIAMAHTDSYQYTLLDNKIVYQHTTGGVNAYIAATTATARGIAIAQNRLYVLGEDTTNGVVLYLYALDQTSYTVAISSTVTVSAAKNAPDTALRQRMTGSPTGARYFVNYSDGTASIYECDSSPSTPTNRLLAVLDDGVKATAILHTSGKTFIAGQFKAETGETPVSALWMIDESGYLRFVGYLRRDASSSAHVQMMRAYQGDLWLYQGQYVWRFSLRTGGLYLEYQLSPQTNTNARALAVVQGHQFAACDEGVWVTGSVGTYRQSGANGVSNHLTSSINDFGIPGTRKALWAIEVVSDSIATGGQIKVEYQTDQDGTWTHAGSVTSGSHNIFFPSSGTTTEMFNTLQVRCTLGSANGTATPVVKSAIVRALPLHDAHFLDVQLLLRDESSMDHPADRQFSGGELAANLWALKNTNKIVTITDAFAHSGADINNLYLARIEAVKQVNTGVGNGTAFVRLRLLGEAA